RMLAQYGKIDVLVNNAGIAPRIRPHDADQAEKWDQAINVNLTAQWDITVALFPAWRNSGARRIFVSCIGGFTAPRSSAADGATKAAVRSLVQDISRTLGPAGGGANGLAPGRIKSALMSVAGEAGEKFLQRVPLGRVG